MVAKVQKSWLATMALSSCLASFMLPHGVADARTIRMDVTVEADPPKRVELQGNFGSSVFAESSGIFSLVHRFQGNGVPAKIVIVYGDSSVAFPVNPRGMIDSMPMRLNVKMGQNCDTTLVNRIRANSNNDDYHKVISAAIHAELLLDSGGCPAVHESALKEVKFKARCKLTRLNNFFDIASYILDGYQPQIRACATQLIKTVMTPKYAQYQTELKKGNFAAAIETFQDIETLLQSENWTELMAEDEQLDKQHKLTKSTYLVTRFIGSQNMSLSTEADIFRNQIMQLRADADYDAAFLAAGYSDQQLDDILLKKPMAVDSNFLMDSKQMDVADMPVTDMTIDKEVKMSPG
jgi:hypothetical protein